MTLPEHYIGLMSGTSMDGIDAVLAAFDTTTSAPQTLHHHHMPMPTSLRDAVRTLAHGKHELARVTALDVQLGQLFALAARELITASGVTDARVRAIGSHGQTVLHRPGGEKPSSWQLGDPNIIAEDTGITTVADFRRRDIAAGGQGAPLVPAFHAAVFTSRGEDRLVLNLGGIANITVLPGDANAPVRGYDTGPANTLLDAWAVRHLGHAYDDQGRWATSGQVHPTLLAKLLDDAYFERPPPKSTGPEYFNLAWLLRAQNGIDPTPAAVDVQATLCELTARSIAAAVANHAPTTQRVLVCGGGISNHALMARIRSLLAPRAVTSTLDYGIDPQWVEATAFAWLAKQTLEGKPGNLPNVTGARHAVVLGAIYPGRVGK